MEFPNGNIEFFVAENLLSFQMFSDGETEVRFELHSDADSSSLSAVSRKTIYQCTINIRT